MYGVHGDVDEKSVWKEAQTSKICSVLLNNLAVAEEFLLRSKRKSGCEGFLNTESYETATSFESNLDLGGDGIANI